MAKNLNDVVIVSALRSPIGRYNGKLKEYKSYELGEKVIKKNLIQSKVLGNEVDEVILGQVLTGDTGQNPARQAAIRAGISVDKTAYIINQVCGSGLRAIVAGYQSLKLNESKIIVAGGQESMSNSEKDVMLKDGLIDAFNNYHMGITAENVAEKWDITRQQQDDFALKSQEKAGEAINKKKFNDELIQDFEIIDEHPRPEITKEKLASLEPTFKKNGTVTAGNSSGINDGAAAVVMTTREIAEKRGLKPLVKISSWATCGVDPSLMGTGPIPSSKKALNIAGWGVSDLDLVESNEAFAAQSLAVIKDLKLPFEKVNVNGGAIALGHPIGASGARILVTLVHEMIKRDVKKGLATLCIGGGMGIAMCIERD